VISAFGTAQVVVRRCGSHLADHLRASGGHYRGRDVVRLGNSFSSAGSDNAQLTTIHCFSQQHGQFEHPR
jgi:hypothetical protein